MSYKFSLSLAAKYIVNDLEKSKGLHACLDIITRRKQIIRNMIYFQNLSFGL
jgi:hypothetical protein